MYVKGCLRYCKSTSFQANHNYEGNFVLPHIVVCDTAKVRVFKQITTATRQVLSACTLFAILQKYEFSSKSQPPFWIVFACSVVCDTAKVRVFKQITTINTTIQPKPLLFAILQKYEFSSKSQQKPPSQRSPLCCLRYCKSTSFQANHNAWSMPFTLLSLFAILQKYEFSSKSQHALSCALPPNVVCDTAKVRVFKQITTGRAA